MPHSDALFAAIAARLQAHARAAPADARTPGAAASHAAVALLLRAPTGSRRGDGLEVLLIRRAERAGDSWSGHIALPGGRMELADVDDRATAAREACEEVGVDVAAHGRWLGALDVVRPAGRAPRITVAPHVFAVGGDAEITANEEVAAAFWVPLRELNDPSAVTEYLYGAGDDEPRRLPAIRCRGALVWGLTHRVLRQFLDRVDAALGAEAIRIPRNDDPK